ncbi:MAG: sodium-dependent transporter [Acidobacteriota bacterium]|nr:sodium-dependent transporter [Acidobacteriota bacterium]
MTTESRGTWGSQMGFILAAAGSAVGLGHIWRFPYVTGENGGAAFVLLYIASVFIIGVPILFAELTLGRRAQLNPVGAIKKVAPRSNWKYLGYLGVSCGLFILSYYALIAGWTFGYIFKTLLGNTVSFQQFAGNAPLNALLYLAFILMTIGVVYGGVQGGIERWSKILMPILPIILLFIIIYSLTLPGSMAGLRFYLRPDFAGVTGNTVLIALGQAFFANSLGMGAMVTYGSYLDKKQNIISSGIGVVSFGILISFLAGLAIFPAVFAMGKSPAAGPELVFVVLPEIFRMMPGGILVGTLFFILLSIAALTSTISLLEVPVAFLIDEKNMRRKVATWLVGGTTVLFGIPSALSFGASDFFTSLPIFGGISFFGMMDYIFGNIALPLGGVMFAFLVGWRWGIPEAVKEICLGNEKFLGIQSKVWAVLLKYFCPVVILLVLLRSSGLLGLLGL